MIISIYGVEIFELVRACLLSSSPDPDVWSFVQLVVFSWLFQNWVPNSGEHVLVNHSRRLKVSTLAAFFCWSRYQCCAMKSSLSELCLPATYHASMAVKPSPSLSNRCCQYYRYSKPSDHTANWYLSGLQSVWSAPIKFSEFEADFSSISVLFII